VCPVPKCCGCIYQDQPWEVTAIISGSTYNEGALNGSHLLEFIKPVQVTEPCNWMKFWGEPAVDPYMLLQKICNSYCPGSAPPDYSCYMLTLDYIIPSTIYNPQWHALFYIERYRYRCDDFNGLSATGYAWGPYGYFEDGTVTLVAAT
jgi:hypothetical protein